MGNSDSDRRDAPRPDDAPQDVSNQNREEPSAPHPGAHGNPGPADKGARDSERSSESKGGSGTRGGAGESSQATGNPKNAG